LQSAAEKFALAPIVPVVVAAWPNSGTHKKLRTFRTVSSVSGGHRLDYPLHDKTLTVTTCGRICFNRQKINLGVVFAGQWVGIKQVSEHIWLVSFMDYDLGCFDLEQKTLQPPR
jgi:putative transposase